MKTPEAIADDIVAELPPDTPGLAWARHQIVRAIKDARSGRDTPAQLPEPLIPTFLSWPTGRRRT